MCHVIGIGGQMHGLVILDSSDNVIRPAVLWNDGRTQKQTEYLNTGIGKKIRSGDATPEELSDYAGLLKKTGIPASGKQERIESIINQITMKKP